MPPSKFDLRSSFFAFLIVNSHFLSTAMRAVIYNKSYSVSVQQVEKPMITHPDDVLVKGLCLSRDSGFPWVLK